jgi:(R)-2-hydroxyacyl-CoA dehydratese activating ATPase
MYFCGCDLGSATGKAVILNSDGIASFSVIQSTISPELTAKNVIAEALAKAGLASVASLKYIVGTGYGREAVSIINENISEITCHAYGAYWMDPKVRTVIDIGGQDSKVISLNDKGKVMDFSMNDKCAAGTGRFFEAMTRTLGCSHKGLSDLALQSETPVNISKQCSVFAESEVITLINKGINPIHIAAGIYDSISRRIHSMVYRLGIISDVVLTGGCGRSKGLVRSLEKRLGVPIAKLPCNPQIAGALGAALLAMERTRSESN